MFLSLLLSSFFTFVELNCENLFNTVHDSLKMIRSFCQRVIITGQEPDIGRKSIIFPRKLLL